MKTKFKLIALTLLVYGLPIFILSVLPFSKSFYGAFESPIINFVFNGKILFSPIGIIFDLLLLYCAYLLLREDISIEEERVYLIYSGLKKIFYFIFVDKIKKDLIIHKEEKVSILFYFVKIVFTPIMINFLINNSRSLIQFLHNQNSFEFTKVNILGSYFYLIFYLILVLDTAIFTFGYLFESSFLKNTVKSVEPTALGWIVALMCYPPFNDITGRILGWYSSDFNDFGNININIMTGLLSLLAFSIYLWASIALGFKASNLTNRGIVSSGPYKYVRHPAYSSKNLSWWIMGIPLIKIYGFVAILSLAVWSFIYFMRALTEEKHLMKDEAYIEYMKKTKYMFIPGIY